MRFARNAKIFRGPLDPIPVVGVMFLLILFLLMASLIYTPGTLIALPAGKNLTGTDNPTVIVAVNADGQCFMENRLVNDKELRANLQARLREETARNGTNNLTLALWVDNGAKYQAVTRLCDLARSLGIQETLLVQRAPLGAGGL